MKRFPLYRQLEAMDCGPTCLKMIIKYYGKEISLEYLRNKTEYNKNGVSLYGLSVAAESLGLQTTGVRISFNQLIEDVRLPIILHWDSYHFIVLYHISKKSVSSFFYKQHNIRLNIADPVNGYLSLSKEDFLRKWISTHENGNDKGIGLILETTPKFYTYKPEEGYRDARKRRTIGWGLLLNYLKNYKNYFIQIGLGMLLGSIIQLIFPYLIQSIVDTGIGSQNLHFIQVVLLAQSVLILSRTLVDFIRSRVLLYISTRINVSLLTAFWTKLLKLPMTFFDTKHPGDILQRLNDQNRIENFLTGAAINTIFALFTIILFSIVLLNYDLLIFSLFIIGSVLYFLWIAFYLRYRKAIDYKRFSIASKENNATMQLVYGMQEIKLNNAENKYRHAWEALQSRLFKLNGTTLSLNQYQQAGAFFLNEGKNILITFLVAKFVIEGKLTLGEMLSIQYIIGQLNSPIEQLITTARQAQDAKMSLDRLNDIHSLEDEEPQDRQFISTISGEKNICIRDLSFRYPGAGNELVLKKINLEIQSGKTTAIVGMSGSGKTTLLKLLLGFYDNYAGEIEVGDVPFRMISKKYWRSITGCVMQDGFIFNDSIANNITVAKESSHIESIMEACRMANMTSFVEKLPLGIYTKLGVEGNALSAGQRQRILIARAIYKDPGFVFLDEATNALDANNETEILKNLEEFYKHRTVLVVAHRLSTVKKADKIIVLDRGEIIEEGTHADLIKRKAKYYELVRNQLELGN